MKSILMGLFVFFTLNFSFAVAPNHCIQYNHKPEVRKALEALAVKLSYSYDEFCGSTRILDIHQEERLIYNQPKDEYDNHLVITLHYNEYSCEYKYNLVDESWGNQYCYSTF